MFKFVLGCGEAVLDVLFKDMIQHINYADNAKKDIRVILPQWEMTRLHFLDSVLPANPLRSSFHRKVPP